uniref:Uncharacterized protein n=1 Tax=Pediastrum angulosum TaxID=271408 RepID=A0A2U8GHV2_9CHLO|nr:hypothetical protein [Pediastrum angulosum]AWI68158.1 hypothetical protein [Pediastrum angulosum]
MPKWSSCKGAKSRAKKPILCTRFGNFGIEDVLRRSFGYFGIFEVWNLRFQKEPEAIEDSKSGARTRVRTLLQSYFFATAFSHSVIQVLGISVCEKNQTKAKEAKKRTHIKKIYILLNLQSILPFIEKFRLIIS